MPFRAGHSAGRKSVTPPSAPVIAGSVTIGSNLTWSAVPTATSYTLFRNGVSATTVTSPYTCVEADCSGNPITIKANNSGGSSPSSNALSYSPSGLTNLRSWLRTDSMTVSGTNVTAWLDQSGHGNDLSTLATSPTRVSNYNGVAGIFAIRGDGAAAGLRKTTFDWGAAVDQYTIMSIGTVNSLTADALYWQYNGGGSQIPYLYALNASSGSAKMFGPGNVTTTGVESGLQPQVVVASWDGSTQKIYDSARLGNTSSNANAGPPNSASFTALGSAVNTLFLNADLVEMVAMRKAITQNELRSFSYYARWRYNIATRVIFCGDSIVYGYGPPYIGGYRPEVLTACTNAGINTQQVGSVNGPNGFHRGIAGEQLADVAANLSTLDNILTTNSPSRLADIVCGAWGTNDALVNSGSDVSATMLTNAGLIMDQMKISLPNAKYLWQTCTRPTDPSFSGLWASIDGYNAGLPALCAAKGFTLIQIPNTVTFLSVSVHPDVAGYTTMSVPIAAAVITASRN